ncbi:MAG: hypothetical protein OEZ59_13515, partial [Deltaproteobacteria bacterium]|nr:hypothetical protein [Deltaproteobacteria bacterium]
MSGFRTELSSQIFKGKTPTILTVLFLLLATLAFSGCNISESSGGKDTKTIGDPTDPDSPQVIKYPGQLPFTDSLSKIDPYTGSGGISYYKIVGLNPGITYRISISSTATFDTYFDSLSVLVYQNPDWSGLECTFSFNSYWSVTSPCPAVSNSEGELYVELTSTVSGKFTLNVEAIVGEGSAAAPIDLTGITPYDTDILDYATSFYKIGGLTPGDSYTVSTSAHSMTMYNDSFTTAICSLSSSCTFTATDNTIWFTVMGAYDDTLFTISFAGNGTPAAIPAEGAIGSEQEITLDTLYSGSVNTSASYYHVSGLTAGSRYRITLSNIFDDNVDLYVFQDATYGSEECFSTAAGTSSEKCETGALAGTELWIEVDGSGALRLLGAYYDLLVEQFFPNEGSGSSTPLELTYDNGLVYSGSVDTVSYYLVSGLAPNTSYVVELRDYTSGNSNISFDLSKTTSSAYSCYTGWEISPGIMTCIITTNADGTIAIDVDEYNYM